MEILPMWFETHAGQGQGNGFRERVLDPWIKWKSREIACLQLRAVWPGIRSDAQALQNGALWLRSMAHELDPNATVDEKPEANEAIPGCPDRLKRISETLRRHGRPMTTAELGQKLGCDPNVVLATSKGATKEDQEYARNHLRQGRGLWSFR